jgi:glycosyltransferase involved in cell wall biosynthesis
VKILLVNHFPLTGSGSGVYTANIANSLVKLGHEVHAIFPDNHLSNEKFAFKTTPVYFTGDSSEKIQNALDFNIPCFTTHPRSTFTFEEMTPSQIEQYTSAFREVISKEIETFKPDVLHCGHIWILASICTEFALPTTITSHGTDLMGIQSGSKFLNFALEAAEKSSAIVAISKGNLKLLEESLPQFKDKFCLITNGYNPDVFYPEKISKEQVLRNFGIDKKYDKIVSFAGKFANFKGVDTLLQANKLYDRNDTATILAGDGDLFDEMTDLKQKLALQNTFFIHNQPHNKLRELYSVADVSLVPSRNEPFGLVAIEAGACGAPIIASKSGGLLDIVANTTGMFFEQDNEKELAECVEKILSGDVAFDRETIAKTTYSYFSQDKFTKKLVDEVYKTQR